MKKLFNRETPDLRADYLRQQKSQSNRIPAKPSHMSQIMPPIKVTTLEEDRLGVDLSSALFNKSLNIPHKSRPSMMKLVYPPLRETALKNEQTPAVKHHREVPQPITAMSKLVARLTSTHTTPGKRKQTEQAQAAVMPRSVYVNPRLIIQQPVKTKRSWRHLQLGWRFISLVLAGALSYFLYFMWTSPSFKILTPVVSGNVRVEASEFIKTMAVEGKPSYSIVLSDIRAALLNTYPEVATLELNYNFPNRINLAVVEREPVLIWKQGNQTMWIDLFGIPMVPRGQAGNWFVVTAEGNAIKPVALDPVNHPGLYKPVADPELILMILNLANMTPAGTAIAYDPRYGLGWNDPQGWKVYFGFNIDGMDSKLAQYDGIVTNLKTQGIQPRLISVQYPYAPFYRLEQ